MDLDQILLNINSHNANQLYLLLKKSKDPKAQEIILDMFGGMDFFDAVSKHVDNVSQIILSTKVLNVIPLLGKYRKFYKALKQAIFSALVYPLILIVLCIILLHVLKQFLVQVDISSVLLLVPVFIFTLIIAVFIFIYKKFRNLVKYKIAILFLEHFITFDRFDKIYKVLGYKHNWLDCSDFKDFSYLIFHENLTSIEEIELFFLEQEENFFKSIESIQANVSKISIVSASVFIIITASTLLKSMQNLATF